MHTTTTTSMSPMRKTALAAGLLYIATFVFSIPALGFYDGVLNNADFVHGAGNDSGVLWGALFEIITALTGIGTAVVLYPVIKRHGPTGAVGFVASRTLEAAAIFVGVMSVLGVYTLRQDFAGSDAAGLTATAHALVAVKDWSFLLGPGIMASRPSASSVRRSFSPRRSPPCSAPGSKRRPSRWSWSFRSQHGNSPSAST
jgi:hypothetical protein